MKRYHSKNFLGKTFFIIPKAYKVDHEFTLRFLRDTHLHSISMVRSKQG